MRILGLLIALGATGCMVGTDPGDDDGGGGNGGGGGFGGGGGTGDGSGMGGPAASVPDVMTKMTRAECDEAFACRASFPAGQGVTFEQVFGATAAACYTQLAADYYDATSVQASITANKITFSASAAGQCVTGIAAMPAPVCATFWQDGPDFPDACYDAFVGKVADGAACANDFECGADSYCGDADTCTAI
jgi:hypothetical protein